MKVNELRHGPGHVTLIVCARDVEIRGETLLHFLLYRCSERCAGSSGPTKMPPVITRPGGVCRGVFRAAVSCVRLFPRARYAKITANSGAASSNPQKPSIR